MIYYSLRWGRIDILNLVLKNYGDHSFTPVLNRIIKNNIYIWNTAYAWMKENKIINIYHSHDYNKMCIPGDSLFDPLCVHMDTVRETIQEYIHKAPRSESLCIPNIVSNYPEICDLFIQKNDINLHTIIEMDVPEIIEKYIFEEDERYKDIPFLQAKWYDIRREILE